VSPALTLAPRIFTVCLPNSKFSCAALNKARSAAEGPQKIMRRLLQRELCGAAMKARTQQTAHECIARVPPPTSPVAHAFGIEDESAGAAFFLSRRAWRTFSVVSCPDLGAEAASFFALGNERGGCERGEVHAEAEDGVCDKALDAVEDGAWCLR